MAEEVTVEDLMQKIVSLEDELNAIKGEKDKFKEELDKANDSLDKTRKLNSDLLNRVPAKQSFDSQSMEDDSFERLMEETINKFKFRKE